MRKDGHVLPVWIPNISNALHGLQLQILRRALVLVRTGGVVCYNMSSLNPIEDEAVVLVALGADGNDGEFKLLRRPEGMLPRFKHRLGVTECWRLAAYNRTVCVWWR